MMAVSMYSVIANLPIPLILFAKRNLTARAIFIIGLPNLPSILSKTNTKNCPADARQLLLFHEQSVLGAVEIVSPAVESGQENLGALLGIEPHEQDAVAVYICDERDVVLLCHAVVEC